MSRCGGAGQMGGVLMLAGLASALWVGPGYAEAPATSPAAASQPTSAPASQPAEFEKTAGGDRSVEVGGRTLDYHVTAANLPMKDEQGKLKATVFFTAYQAKVIPPAKAEDRPITFVFNGGPGAAAVWLHLGTAGPQRVSLTPEGFVPPPPYRVIPNEHTWLDVTDLVFIDPVGTGFSRPAEGEKGDQFYGVREDIEWVADFIRLYTTLTERWASPKFLAGESYGTTRAAGLSEYLLDRHGIALNGIMLISSVLDFQTIDPGDLNDLPYVLYLPGYTASAYYHGKLAPDLLNRALPDLLAEVEHWAVHTYGLALARGSTLPEDERRQIAGELAHYTSLDAGLILRDRLRIQPWIFRKKLLEDSGRLIGRFDARVVGEDPEPAAGWPAFDPSLSGYLAVYSGAFNDYIRRDLGYKSLLPYEVLSDKVQPWNYGKAGRGYLSVADNLRDAMIKNPHLKILFASGYFDLATPYFATEYTIGHLNLPAPLLGQIRHHRYPGGHMMYHEAGTLAALKRDIAGFIGDSLPPP